MENGQGSNKAAYVISGIVVLAIVVWGIYAYNQEADSTVQKAPDQGSQTTASTSNDSSITGTAGGSGKLSYGDAIAKYQYRIQFSKCSGDPGLISVKKGSAVMLDNRDAVAHTFKANGQSVKIAAYDYAVVYPSITSKDNADLTLSNITCDGGGAATLNVDK